MRRISRGFQLLGASWQVLRADRELLVLPLISMAATVVVAGTLAGAGWVSGLFEAEVERNEEYARWLLLGIFYFAAYTIGIFFNAAIVGAAMIRLEGGDPTLGDGIRAAWSKFDRILGWAAIAATVGLILHAIQERGGALGNIVGRVAGVAWSAVTFFVVPVILFEEQGVGGSMKRSAQIFKQRWGEQFTGNVAISLAVFLAMLPFVLFIAPMWTVSPPLTIALLLLVFAAGSAVAAATTGIFNAALYRYAVAGEARGPFAEGDLSAAFVPQTRRRRFGRPASPAPFTGTLEQYVREQGLPATVDEARAQRPSESAAPPQPRLFEPDED